jgi:phage tail protein X
VAGLEARGFVQVERRNTWTSDQYKGINARWREPKSGVLFEVQFHTQASHEAKELTHKAYERIRTRTEETLEANREAAELKEFQREVNVKLPIPPGVTEYEDYRLERRNGRGD